jgi:hypothetical protein
MPVGKVFFSLRSVGVSWMVIAAAETQAAAA